MKNSSSLKKYLLPLLFSSSVVVIILYGFTAREPQPQPAPELTPASVEYWQEKFPAQTASYLRTGEMEPTPHGGSVPYQKLTAYPFMRAMYHGFGFWFDFRESRGHIYSVEDTLITGRAKFGGVCWACKSAEYPALTAEYGQKEFDTMYWSEAAGKAKHPVSCIDCHDPQSPDFELRLTRPWLEEAIAAQGKTLADFDLRSLTCAQCHSEYYFENPGTENKIVYPWSFGFRPDDALAHYDAEGFSDWIHPRTGAGVLKVQHPEFEYFQDSVHAGLGLSCVDCHMPRVQDAQGKEYTQHWLTSPLKHAEASCQRCHADIDSIKVRTVAIQDELRKSANEIGAALETAINKMRDARRVPNVDQDLIRQAQAKHRRAQFILDWLLVENSTGFHNAAEGRRILEEARRATEEMADLTEKSLP